MSHSLGMLSFEYPIRHGRYNMDSLYFIEKRVRKYHTSITWEQDKVYFHKYLLNTCCTLGTMLNVVL